MFMLQLAWVASFVTVVVCVGATSRAAFGDSVLGGSAYLAVWGSLVVALWAHTQRAGLSGRSTMGLRLAFVPALLAGLGTADFMAGDGGIRAFGWLLLLPFLTLLLCPAIALLSARQRDVLRVDPPGGRRPAPPPLALLITLAPSLLFACVAAALTGNELTPAFDGLLASNGLRGILFGDLTLWALPAAILIGSGLDALDASDDGPLTRKLVLSSLVVLLLAAALRPFPAAFSATTSVSAADGQIVAVELPLQGMRLAAPLMLLTLAGLLRRDLRALGRGEPAPPLLRQVLLLASVAIGGWTVAPSFGPWWPPSLAAAGCALVITYEGLSRGRATPPVS